MHIKIEIIEYTNNYTSVMPHPITNTFFGDIQTAIEKTRRLGKGFNYDAKRFGSGNSILEV
jgi:hypothetical protein